MWRKFWNIIEKPFLVLSSFCSIISVVALCFNNLVGTIIAVSALCIALIVLLIAIIRVLDKFLEPNDAQGDHKCISSFVKYRTYDGENIECESYKLIQVKCSIMQYFNIGFKWSGKDFPTIESDLQDVVLSKKADNDSEYDNASLKLKSPALYNQTTVIHFRTKANDAAQVSEPKVELCVRYPIEIIHVNITLGHKTDNFHQTAKVERVRIGSMVPQKYELLTSIPFESTTKQYTYSFINPEPGYFYKISWER